MLVARQRDVLILILGNLMYWKIATGNDGSYGSHGNLTYS